MGGSNEFQASVEDVFGSAAIPVSSALMDGFSFVYSNLDPKRELITDENDVLALCTDEEDEDAVVTSIATSSIKDVALPPAADPNIVDVHKEVVVHLPFINSSEGSEGSNVIVAGISFIPDNNVNSIDPDSFVLADSPGYGDNSAVITVPSIDGYGVVIHNVVTTNTTLSSNEVFNPSAVLVYSAMSKAIPTVHMHKSSEGSLVPRCVTVFAGAITDNFHEQLHCPIVPKAGTSAEMYVQCFDPGIVHYNGDNVRPRILPVGCSPEKSSIAWRYHKFVLTIQFGSDFTALLVIAGKDSLHGTVDVHPALNQFVYFYNSLEEILQMKKGIHESNFFRTCYIVLVSSSGMIVASCGDSSAFLCHGNERSSLIFSGTDTVYVRNKVPTIHVSTWHNIPTSGDASEASSATLEPSLRHGMSFLEPIDSIRYSARNCSS